MPGHEAPAPEEVLRVVAHVGGQPSGAARGRELLQRIDQHGADPVAGGRRMHVEHIDAVAAIERCEADRRSVDDAEQGQALRQPRPEGQFVVGDRRPSPLLGLAVIVPGQLLDAGAQNLGDERSIGRQVRPERQLGMRTRGHRIAPLAAAVRRSAARAAGSLPSPLVGEGRPRAARSG